jgi:hypothetical protein
LFDCCTLKITEEVMMNSADVSVEKMLYVELTHVLVLYVRQAIYSSHTTLDDLYHVTELAMLRGMGYVIST